MSGWSVNLRQAEKVTAMKLKAWMLIVLALSSTPAFSLNNKNECKTHPITITKIFERIEADLPAVPEQESEYFSDLYDASGLPRFYKYKDKPYYYLWLLHTSIDEAKASLINHSSEKSFTTARSALAFSADLSLRLSNARNAWTEYQAYSDSKDLSDDLKEEFTDQMLSTSVLFSLYLSCLVVHLKPD